MKKQKGQRGEDLSRIKELKQEIKKLREKNTKLQLHKEMGTSTY